MSAVVHLPRLCSFCIEATAQYALLGDVCICETCAGGRIAHPDAALLGLCTQLAEQQAEWQRLWAACPDDADAGPEIDALEAYSDTVWPGSAGSAAELVSLMATTPEGVRAKAVAALALHQTGMYVDAQHEDKLDIMASALCDAAGSDYRPVGEDAEPPQ